MVLSLGGDPSALMSDEDPVSVGLWLHMARRAAVYAAHRDRKQALDIALMSSGEKPTPLED